MKKNSHRRSAFTLIEILVVLGIVAILAILLFTQIEPVLEKSRRAQCASNLRVLVSAALLYANDNNGLLPASVQANYPFAYDAPDYESEANPRPNKGGSYFAIQPYLGEKNYKVMTCPSMLARLKITPEESLFTEKGYWGASYYYFGGNPKSGVSPIWVGSADRVISPARTLLFGDLAYGDNSTADLPMRPGSHVGKEPATGKLVAVGANWAFIDGSVQWFSKKDLTVVQPCAGQFLLRPDTTQGN